MAYGFLKLASSLEIPPLDRPEFMSSLIWQHNRVRFSSLLVLRISCLESARSPSSLCTTLTRIRGLGFGRKSSSFRGGVFPILIMTNRSIGSSSFTSYLTRQMHALHAQGVPQLKPHRNSSKKSWYRVEELAHSKSASPPTSPTTPLRATRPLPIPLPMPMPRRARAPIALAPTNAAHLDTLLVARRTVPPGPASPRLPDDDGGDVDAPDERGDDAVRDLAAARVVGELEAQASVDDAEGDDDAAEPDVAVGPDHAARVLLEQAVVQQSQDRLEENEHEEDDADDRVGFVELWISSYVSADGLSGVRFEVKGKEGGK